MSTFALIHGAGDGGWYWHLVEAELRARGHRTVAPDLPADDDAATLTDYADVVEAALDAAVDGAGDDVVVVGQSFGAFTAPLVAARRPVTGLVLVAGMVPSPGERPADWWTNTGYSRAEAEQAAADGGLTGSDDPRIVYYHDVPEALADEALRRERAHPSSAAYTQRWPLEAWPDVPTGFVLCTRDRQFPAEFLRRVVRDRLGIAPDELDSGHCPALARPEQLAGLLDDALTR
jgi:pimeloyl-ACP methyl ester carboxylesterase